MTIDELADDIDFAQRVVDGYWQTHWTEFFTGSYEPPVVKGLYDGTDPDNTPTCDGEPLEAYNAYYCEDGNYVAWDANLLLEGADQVGDSWVYLVIAHEWGHAVQARLDPGLVAVELELQADCLGGAALFGAIADKTLELEEGDERELISSLNLLADEMAWTMSSDHGDPFQRVQWFTLGRNGGVNACLDAVQTSDGSTPTDRVPPSERQSPRPQAAPRRLMTRRAVPRPRPRRRRADGQFAAPTSARGRCISGRDHLWCACGAAGRIGFQRNTGVDLPGLGRPSWHPDSRVLEVRRQPGWGWCVLLPALSASAVDA